MPEDRKVFDIARPVATPATRPVISSGPPAPDPMVKPATKVAVMIQDESAAAAITEEPKTEETLPPAIPSEPLADPVQISQPIPDSQPAPPAEIPAEVEPQIDNIEVNDPPALAADPAVAFEASGSGSITPALPGAPASDFSNVPKFGELQPKINAHPLFSGTKEHRVKVRRVPGFVRPLSVLLIIAAAAYLAVDAGAIRGYSHLPFHVFKAKSSESLTPVITPQQNAASAGEANPPAQTADPYAGWKTYSDANISFKYPVTWSVDTNNEKNGFLNLMGPTDSSISLVDPATKQASTTFTAQHIGAVLNFKPTVQEANRACMSQGTAIGNCLIYDASALNVQGAANSQLVIYDIDKSTHPDFLTVSDDPAAVLNAKAFKNGFMINGKLAILNANVEYLKNVTDKSFLSNGWISSVSDFKNSQSYKDLSNLFQSVVIK